jgi:hypothetical protein
VRRRHLLALCAAGVSGCAGLVTSGDDGVDSPTPTPTATATPTPTPSGTPTATAVPPADSQRRPLSDEVDPLREITVDILDDSLPFAHGARVDAVPKFDDDPDSERVPRLTVTIRNRTGRARSLYAAAGGLPLPRRRLRGPNGNAIVVRRRFNPAANECSGSLTPTPDPSATGTPSATPAPTPQRREIEPGETFTRTYRIFSAPGNPDGCLPTGQYRLGQPYVAVTDEERLRYRWGFTLSVRG